MGKMISVIVCTHNREDLIDDCIQSLLNQKTVFDYELIVVDNNSTDGTKKIIKKYERQSPLVTYSFEEELGISKARNTGCEKAKYDWVAYVDDDAKAHSDFVEVACHTITNYKFDCFGGVYNAWFKYGEEPSWFPPDAGSNRYRMPGKVTVLNDQCFSAGACVFNKQMLTDIGGFPTQMGPKGEIMEYGEENYVQIKARKLGYVVGFNPALQIDHVVREEKLKKSWHYSRAYLLGVSKAKLQVEPKAMILIDGILEIFKYPVRSLFNRSFFTSNQNIMFYKGYLDQVFKKR